MLFGAIKEVFLWLINKSLNYQVDYQVLTHFLPINFPL